MTPWLRRLDGDSDRYHDDDECADLAASVFAPHERGRLWRWLAWPDPSGAGDLEIVEEAGYAQTEQAAKDAADAVLRARGWVLP